MIDSSLLLLVGMSSLIKATGFSLDRLFYIDVLFIVNKGHTFIELRIFDLLIKDNGITDKKFMGVINTKDSFVSFIE